MENPLAQGPLSTGALLRATWALYRRRWLSWLLLTAVAYLPFYVVVQLSNISAEYGETTLWTVLVPVAMGLQTILMSGIGAIFVADGLRGERATLWYALDLLITQRLGRVVLLWLLTGIVADVVAFPILLLRALNLLPYEAAIALLNALPWIMGVALLLIAAALFVTRQQRYFPVLLAVAFVIAYSIVIVRTPDQSIDFQNGLLLFSQGARLVMNSLFLLIVPIVAIDPGPLWRTVARGWRIAKANLPLIFVILFLVGLAINLVENFAQAAAYLLPGPLAADQMTSLVGWQVSTNYVNALIYYVPLSLLFVAAVFSPLQVIFATLVTLNGYRMFGAEVDSEESKADEWDDEDDSEEDSEDVDAEIAGEEPTAQVAALDSPADESSQPIDAAEESGDTDDLDEQETAAESAEPAAEAEAQPLLTYRDLLIFAGFMILGTGLNYLSNTLLNAVVDWLRQLIA